MSQTVKTVTGSLTLHDLQGRFEADRINGYPVVEDDEVVGFVTAIDFLKAFILTPASMVPRYDDLMEKTVAEVMTSAFIYVGSATKLTRVLQLMVDHRLRSIPVLEPDRRLVGIVSRKDIMRALQASTASG